MMGHGRREHIKWLLTNFRALGRIGSGNLMGGVRHGTAQAAPLVTTSHLDGKDGPGLVAAHPEQSIRFRIKKKNTGEKVPETSAAPRGDAGRHGARRPAPDPSAAANPTRPPSVSEGAARRGGGSDSAMPDSPPAEQDETKTEEQKNHDMTTNLLASLYIAGARSRDRCDA